MVRIGDAEREHAVSTLGDAFAAGRLTVDEYESRVTEAQSATTEDELGVLLRDLVAQPQAETQALAPANEMPLRLTTVFSGTTKKGQWRVPSRIKTLSVFGGSVLDLREAQMPAEIHIKARVVFGGMELIVPPGTDVEWNGVAIFGGVDVGDGEGQVRTRIKISGLLLFGGVDVQVRQVGESVRQARKRRKAQKQLPPPQDRSLPK